MDSDQLIDALNANLVLIDEYFAKEDMNGALKKVHECMNDIKVYKDKKNTDIAPIAPEKQELHQ